MNKYKLISYLTRCNNKIVSARNFSSNQKWILHKNSLVRPNCSLYFGWGHNHNNYYNNSIYIKHNNTHNLQILSNFNFYTTSSSSYNDRNANNEIQTGKSTAGQNYNVHKVIKGREIIQNVLEQKKEMLLEKKDDLVKDIQMKKNKVKEKMEEVIERENVMTIPNLLCVGRAILAPYLGYVIIQGDFTLAMGLLVAAGISDLLDGYIARTWPSQASKMGSFLDPMADKLLVGSLYICLSYTNLLPIWLTVMVLFRDVFLILAGFVIRYISLPPPKTLSRYFDVTHATAQLAPTFISKVNTVVQLVAVASSLGAPIWNYIDHPLLHGLWYLTGFTTAAAALSYITVKDTYKILKKK